MEFPRILAYWSLSILTLSSGALPAWAQEVDNAPIYLDEPEPEPQPRVAARKTLKDTYPDKKTPRFERGIAKLSDDRIINDGIYIEYYPSGQKYTEGNYKMGAFHGDWSYWFPNGQLCKKVSFKDGRPDGQWEEFNEEGTRTASKGYKDGRRHGKWLVYHDGGENVRFQVSYDAGVPVDRRITFFENGQKRQEVAFKDGKFHGMMTEWDATGKKVGELEFIDGERQGDAKRFD